MSNNPVMLGISIVFPVFAIANFYWMQPLTSALFVAGPDNAPPKPGGFSVQTSQYGQTIPYLRGTRKFAGNLLGYFDFQSHEHKQEVGGKGGSEEVTTGYTYTVSMVWGLCMGPAMVRSIWIGKERYTLNPVSEDRGEVTCYIRNPNDGSVQGTARVYTGNHTKGNARWAQFVPRAPVYKDLCYIVFESFNLGNSTSMPNISFEVASYQPGTRPQFKYANNLVVDPTREAAYVFEDYGHFSGWNPQFARMRFFDAVTLGDLGDTLYLTPIITTLWSVISQDGAYLFVGGRDDRYGTYYIHQINLFTKQITNTTTLSQADGKLMPKCATSSPQHIFAGTDNGTIIKMSIADATVETGIPGGDYINQRWGAEPAVEGFSLAGSQIYDIVYNAADKGLYYVAGGNDTIPDYGPWGGVYPVVGVVYPYPGYLPDLTWWDGSLSALPPAKLFEKKSNIILMSFWWSYGGMLASDGSTVTLLGASHPAFPFSLTIGTWPLPYTFHLLTSPTLPSTPSMLIGRGQPTPGMYDGTFVYEGAHWNVTMPEHAARMQYSGIETAAREGKTYTATDAEFLYLRGLVIVLGNDGKLYQWTADDLEDVPFIGALEWDVTPPDVTEQILTNDLYGLRWNWSMIDANVNDTTRQYCIGNDFRVSILIDRQMSVLDALQYVISHHNGYITYSGGQIAHRQLQRETPRIPLSLNDLPKEPGKLPVEISQSTGRDTINRVAVEYTKRDQDYVIGYASDEDWGNIDVNGLRSSSTKLDGLTKFSRGAKMANFMIRRALANPMGLSFKLGLKTGTILPGEVYTIDCAEMEIADLPIRISATREKTDYTIEVSATEEVDTYDYGVFGDDTATPGTVPSATTAPASVLHPIALELPAQLTRDPKYVVTFGQPEASYGGASLYAAYIEDGSYNRIESASRSGITAVIIGSDSAGDTAYMDILLDHDETLYPAISLADLLLTPGKNLAVLVVPGATPVFFRFEDAVLTAAKTYRLSGIICDVTGTPRYNYLPCVNRGDLVAIHPHVFTEAIAPADTGRARWLKIPSYNQRGKEQSLAKVMPISLPLADLVNQPALPWGITVNGLPVDIKY